MGSLRERLRADDPVELKKVVRRFLVASTLAFIGYMAITLWRFLTIDRYAEALEFAEVEDVGSFLSGSRSIIQANYGVLAFGAFLVFSCGIMGTWQKSSDQMYLACTCTGCCVLVSIITLIAILVAGDLCSEENNDSCDYLRAVHILSIFTTLLLLFLYSCAWYYSMRLANTGGYFVTQSNGMRVSTRSYTSQPPRNSNYRNRVDQDPSQQNLQQGDLDDGIPVADHYYYAEPVDEAEIISAKV